MTTDPFLFNFLQGNAGNPDIILTSVRASIPSDILPLSPSMRALVEAVKLSNAKVVEAL